MCNKLLYFDFDFVPHHTACGSPARYLWIECTVHCCDTCTWYQRGLLSEPNPVSDQAHELQQQIGCNLEHRNKTNSVSLFITENCSMWFGKLISLCLSPAVNNCCSIPDLVWPEMSTTNKAHNNCLEIKNFNWFELFSCFYICENWKSSWWTKTAQQIDDK